MQDIHCPNKATVSDVVKQENTESPDIRWYLPQAKQISCSNQPSRLKDCLTHIILPSTWNTAATPSKGARLFFCCSS